MELSSPYKSSNLLTYNVKLSNKMINSVSVVTSEKPLMDFISSKSKLVFKSCFDKKGTKKFLSEKEKAMAEITLFDELLDEDTIKIKKKSHSKRKSKKNRNVRSKSEKDILTLKDKKNIKSNKKENIHSNKNVKKKSGLILSINYVDEDKKGKNYEKKIANLNSISNDNALKRNKKRIVKLSSISSNFSNINCSEPLNLIMNKNDSFIHSILNEMGKGIN